MRKEVIMGYGYDPEETTGQEYTDSVQNAGASDMAADSTSAYSSGNAFLSVSLRR